MTQQEQQPPPQPAPPPINYQSSQMIETNPDARMWAMFCHLGGLGGFIIPVVGSIIGPLIFWSIKRAEYPFVDDQGKEALNFQITVAIAGVVCFLLIFVVIGFFLLPVVGLLALIFTVIGAIKANSGEYYRYPLSIRLIK